MEIERVQLRQRDHRCRMLATLEQDIMTSSVIRCVRQPLAARRDVQGWRHSRQQSTCASLHGMALLIADVMRRDASGLSVARAKGGCITFKVVDVRDASLVAS